MLLMFFAILCPFLILVRPLQRNKFFIFYFALMILSAYITEEYYFKVKPLSHKAVMLFIVYHIACINISTFFAYWADKRAAIKGDWRTPEAHLHALEFLGGWIGALFAQKIFHHKNKKHSYQIMFWLMLVLECAAIYIILKYLGFIY